MTRVSQSTNVYPAGWDRARVQAVLDYYENLTEDEAMAEDKAAFSEPGQTWIQVPSDLLPAIERLLAEHEAA